MENTTQTQTVGRRSRARVLVKNRAGNRFTSNLVKGRNYTLNLMGSFPEAKYQGLDKEGKKTFLVTVE